MHRVHFINDLFISGGYRGGPRGGGGPMRGGPPHAQRNHRGGGGGPRGAREPLKFDGEFDFETANAQFDKDKIEKEIKKLTIGDNNECK